MLSTKYIHFNKIKLLLAFVFCGNILFSQEINEIDSTLNSEVDVQKLKMEVDSIAFSKIDSAELHKPGRKTISLAPVRKDTMEKDSNEVELEHEIIGSAVGNIKTNFVDGKVNLWDNAFVEYGDIKIEAYHIEIDRKTNEVFAEPMPDTSAMIGAPIFTQGGDKFYAKSIRFNFKTKKGYIREVFTKQDEGFLHGDKSKKHEDGQIHIEDGKFTTCPYGHHPHFHMHLSRAMVEPNDKVVSDYAYLVVAGTPMPLWIPFGVFPSSSESSHGILFPSFGQDYKKGLYLKDLGYYFPISDYMDLAVKTSWYSRGSRDMEVNARFAKKYKYTGDFNLKTLKNVDGTVGSIDYGVSSSYNLRFNWRQDPKSDPTSNFSASVNYMSSDFYKKDINSVYDPNKSLQSSINSSMSYSKSWEYARLSMSANASQNTKTQKVNLSLPNFNLTSKDIYFFRFGKQSGKAKWYEKLKTKLSVQGRNSIVAHEDEIWDKGFNDYKHGLTYSAPFGASESFLRFFTFNYSFNLKGAVMTKKIKKTWHSREEYGVDEIVTDTINGLYNTFNVGPSTGLSFRPKVYFMYNFIEGLKVNAIRHVMTPSISLSYTPNIGLDEKAYYDVVQKNRKGDVQEYSMFNGVNAYGAPSRGGDEQGSLSFSLDNNVEMKVNDGYDKDGNLKTEKIALLKSLNFSSSYNLFADSLNLSNINMSARTSIFGTSINFNASFVPYAIDSLGRKYNKFEIEENGILARPQSAGLSFSLNLNNTKMISFGKAVYSLFTGTEFEDDKDKDGKKKGRETSEQDAFLGGGSENKKTLPKPATYMEEFNEFKMPWSLSLSYSMRYNNRWIVADQRFKSEYKHYLSGNGNLTLTKNTKLTFRADYDFEKFEIASFNMGITRDMHCWQSSFNWVPFGNYRSFNFRIALKSSMLSDTFKYEADRRYNYNF